jgi:hypothetical protein
MDYVTINTYYSSVQNDEIFAQNHGYADILQGFWGSLKDFNTAILPKNSGNFLGNFPLICKESCFIFKLEANNRELIAGDSFLLELLLVNPSNLTISNVSVSLDILVQDTGMPADDYFTIGTPVLNGITGNIHGQGIIPATKQATVAWPVTSLFTQDSGVTAELFEIGGTVEYSQGGNSIQVPFFREVIVNYPPPVLQVDYFLPKVFVGYACKLISGNNL